jgi:hypothetical protein
MSTILRSRRLASIITLVTAVLAASPAQAEITGARIAINPPGGGATVFSATVTTMAIVANPAVGKVSYIEIFGVTEGMTAFGLKIFSRDQRRMEAFYNQILQATALHQEFQITVYATSTFQVGEIAGYNGDLDIGWNYFILH